MPDYYNQFRRRLTQEEQQVNATFIYGYLNKRGWSLNAIAAGCGNWESECTMNPNRPQYSSYPSSGEGGFGLPQWTPWGKKYGAWCSQRGIANVASDNNPAGVIELQLDYHDYECIHGIYGGKTWYNNHGYSYKWSDWKISTDSPETLAVAYYWQYERSGAQDPGSRGAQARKWYEFLSGVTPPEPPDPTPTTKNLGFVPLAYGAGLL